MPKVKISNSRGLEQSTGTGMVCEELTVRKDGVAKLGHTGLIVGKGSAADAQADPYTQGTTQLWPLGTRMIYGDREFLYVLMGGSGVTSGKLCSTAAHQGAHHKDMNSTAAVPAGSYTVSVETNGTNLTLNQYAGGYLYVNDGTGEGQLMKIKSHAAHVHGSDPTCVFTLYDPVETALGATTTSSLTICQNKGYKVVVAAHAEVASVVGATVIAMDASNYGWLQTRGPAALLTNGTVVVGNKVTRSTGTVAGGVEASTNTIHTNVGECMVVNLDTEYSLIDLRL